MKHEENCSHKLEITFLNYYPGKETQKHEYILKGRLFKMNLF